MLKGGIILLILLKSLNNKKYWIITILLYAFSLLSIIYMAYNPHLYVTLDMSKINEKNVNYFYVLSSNLLIIIKNYGFGLLTFAIYVFFSCVQNIISLGIIANALIINGHVALFYKMIPHGVLELFGIIISFTAILFCFYKIVYMLPRILKSEVSIKKVILELATFLLASMLLEVIIFLIAGFIEVFVSWVKVT